ncbi:MAG: hypothetical protein IJ773_13155 [Lachnospiraceae bacterium]|nr:hypothetical protein [Lachnospiraceae bacterium]
MKAFRIRNLKKATSALFAGELFDSFLFYEGTFHTSYRLSLDGRRNLSFYSEDEKPNLPDREYITWAEVRPLCFQILKGKKLPVSFKLVLMDPARPEEADRLINIRYEHDQLTIITSVSFKTFTRNRDLEQEWDAATYRLLCSQDIDADEE